MRAGGTPEAHPGWTTGLTRGHHQTMIARKSKLCSDTSPLPQASMLSETSKVLQPPRFATMCNFVTGAETDKMRLQNRCQQHELQAQQLPMSMWTTHTGNTTLLPAPEHHLQYCNKMCPTAIATSHPAGAMLAKWSQLGCPTEIG